MGKTIKNLKHTFVNTILLLLLQVGNIVLSTQLLGSVGRGEISLYLLHITIGAQVGSIVGGEALVYFVPRYNLKSIFKTSLIWNFIVAAFSIPILLLIEAGLAITIVISLCIFLQSMFQMSLQIFNGSEQIKNSNTAFLIAQGSFTVLLILLYIVNSLTVFTYMVAFAPGVCLAIVYFYKNSHKISKNTHLPDITFALCFKNGAVIQLGNLAQTLNSRLSYFLLNAFFANGKALIGVFSTALLVGEKSLVVPKSLGRVQYSEVSNAKENAALKTVLYLKMYLSLAFVTFCFLALIPNWIYTFIFGDGFAETGNLIIVLIPGLFFLMGSNAMSNHFAGEGKYSVNALCTIFALILSSIFAYLYIPKLGMLAAALSADLAFVLLAITQLLVFYKQNKKVLPKHVFLPNKEDWKRLKSLLQKVE